jgi:multidrug resistance efflux pump
MQEETIHMVNGQERSGMVQEIISRRPVFIERWALTIILLVMIALLAATWFIMYPDIILTNATLTAANAPKELVTRQEGKIVRLFAANDDTVAAGQAIAWMESTADHSAIMALADTLDLALKMLSKNETERISRLFIHSISNLGELQPSFQQFNTAFLQFNDYLVNGYYYKRKRMLFSDQEFLRKMQVSLEQQKQLAGQDLQLSEEAFAANSSLYDEKVISHQDLRDQKSRLVGKQMNIPQLQSALLTNENQQIAKQKEEDELEHTISQQKIIFQQALQTLKSNADEWIRKYVIKAPVGGRIVFVMPLQPNQFLQAGKILGYVNPGNSLYYAQVTLPQDNFGKIATGQKVQLRFNAYPYQEFGIVEGRVIYISRVPSDSGFLANIALSNGLMTNLHHSIQYRSGLRAQALIITRETRLLKRAYQSVVSGVQR